MRLTERWARRVKRKPMMRQKMAEMRARMRVKGIQETSMSQLLAINHGRAEGMVTAPKSAQRGQMARCHHGFVDLKRRRQRAHQAMPPVVEPATAVETIQKYSPRSRTVGESSMTVPKSPMTMRAGTMRMVPTVTRAMWVERVAFDRAGSMPWKARSSGLSCGCFIEGGWGWWVKGG